MRAIVIHPGGALGDFVLTFPLVRSLMHAGHRVTVVAASSRAALAAEVLNVETVGDHLPAWSGLWRGDVAAKHPEVTRVVAFGPRPAEWRAAAAATWPNASIDVEERAFDRNVAIELADAVGPQPTLELANQPRGPVVLHAGAGGTAKAWPLERWIRLQSILRPLTEVRLIAGEVEAEQWPAPSLRRFEQAGGKVLPTAHELISTLRSARMFVGGDSGPGHLAAQLGLPTRSLFGPTNPGLWRPIGPDVRVLCSRAASMVDLTVETVSAELLAELQLPEIQGAT